MAIRKISNINDELDFKLFFFIAKKNIFIAFFIISIAIITAFIYLRYTLPLYETSTLVQLNTDNQANKILGTESIYEDDLAKKIELLKSPVFLQRVFSKLPLKISYYNEGRFLNYELYKNFPYNIEVNVKSSSIYSIPIFIKTIKNNKYEISYTLANHTKVEKSFNINEEAIFNELNIKVSPNANLMQSNFSASETGSFFVVNDPNSIVPTYSKQLTISVLSEAAKTILIKFNDNNPQKASDIVNTISDEFNAYDLEKKAESANKILDFIDGQLEIVYDNLYKSETDLINFKKSNNIDSNDIKPLPTVYSRINDFGNQIVKLELEDNILSEIDNTIKKNKDLDVYKLIAIMAGSEFQGTISNLLNSLQEQLMKKEQLLYEVTANSGQIEAINYQIEIQKKLLMESVKTLKNNITSRKADLNQKLEGYQLTVNTGKGNYNTLELSRLQRLYTINEKFYNQLIEKKAEYSISKAGYVSQNIILQRSIAPAQPISPNKKTIYLSSILIGFILSLLLVIIRYLFYNDILDLNDIRKYTNAAILGIVPKYEKNIPVSQLLVDKNPKSLIAESLRTIRSNLQFISNEPGSKVIAITSTISGEGKTFVSINLAGIIAFSDNKVIIIDLDMRKPKIHLGFGAENKSGMSTILSGKDKIDDCIQQSEIKNLHFITAGPIPPNPSELILGKKMNELVDYLKTIYDFVIIDNPPVGIVSDGMSSIQSADYPIYVLKADYSKRGYIQNINRLINESKIYKLSIILNSVQIEDSGYGYAKKSGMDRIFKSGNGIGYGYSYGYGYYDEEKEDVVKKPLLKRIKKFFNL
ncbi:MAG: polysaccharide biosynthesis tyrosine autokinase [Bacteroidetes bacterium]|nr:polysaccharide biosynthesis tyrosine autokinase [Bacteroidota bacterium]